MPWGDDSPKLQKPLALAGATDFVTSAGTPASFPPEQRVEVAFAGRSNVGKSSLLNSLAQIEVANVEDKPGVTQTINFFHIGKAPAELCLVDLPGYGFAYAKEEKVDEWTSCIHDYLSGRKALKRVYMVIDSRHGLKESDRRVGAMLTAHAIKYQVVMTKTDLVKPIVLAKMYWQVHSEVKEWKHCLPDVAMVSSRTSAGMDDLRERVAQALPGYKADVGNRRRLAGAASRLASGSEPQQQEHRWEQKGKGNGSNREESWGQEDRGGGKEGKGKGGQRERDLRRGWGRGAPRGSEGSKAQTHKSRRGRKGYAGSTE
jgi:ribosome biogenesis GTP-binding protein YsxC/EngB